MTKQKERRFPFVPKSNQLLRPGDYWAVPLRNGAFGCGRVIELPPLGAPGSKVSFLGALLDWKALHEPTSEAIAGAGVLRQGVMHILAITTTGGSILGHRPLDADNIEPWLFVDGNVIKRGFVAVRPWQHGDNESLPGLFTWGYDVIRILADKHLASAP